MSLADLMAIHDLAVEAGIISPFILAVEDLRAELPARNTIEQCAALYAFVRRDLGMPEVTAKATYRWALANI